MKRLPTGWQNFKEIIERDLIYKKTRQEKYEMTYFLGYPNVEVHKSLVHNSLEAFTHQTSSVVGVALLKMQGAL